MTDCTYRPNLAVDDELNDVTYNTVGASGFKYAAHLLNDRGYYLGETAAIPPGWAGGTGETPSQGYARLTDNRLRLYQAHEPSPLPRQAVILIHGNSETPEGWDETIGWDGRGSYLNHAGVAIRQQGYATYQLYITHASRFQNARDRLARPGGGGGYDLDALRTADLYEQAAPYYDRVHVAGISGGGTAAILGWVEIRRRASPSLDRAGVVLSVEGYAPADGWVTLSAQHQDWALFDWQWEGTASGPTRAQFLADVDDPHVYLAYGSCAASGWLPQYDGVDPAQLIAYDGGHEFVVGVLWEAIRRYGPL